MKRTTREVNVRTMDLEEINEIEDQVSRLRLLKEHVKERLSAQIRQIEYDASYDDDANLSNDPPQRDDKGGMMSTAKNTPRD